MKALIEKGSDKKSWIDLFRDHQDDIARNDTSRVADIRHKAFDAFRKLDFPGRRTEGWKHTNLEPALSRTYVQYLDGTNAGNNIDDIFTCEVHNFETDQVSLLNGWHVKTDEPLKKHPGGMIAGSLARAMKEYPELVDAHFGKYADLQKNIFHALNTSFAQDGVFIYVPDNVVIEKPIQMISILNHSDNLMVHSRNLVILGSNSRLTLVQCDDSINLQPSFTNSLTEVFVGEGASLDHYKLQNLNDDSTLLNSSFFHQEKESRVRTNSISLNGGLLRNYTHVKLDGRFAEADVFGVYLMDKQQHIDNQVYVHHAAPDCRSSELFKGIIDDKASSVFNGHIMVDRDAQKTVAYQNNRNILLTDEASANSKPFLEIYADDVKCSHGATVGQLDTESLFYIRSRGICEASARLLMMYAFAAEIINEISIEPLRNRIDDMVKKRLRGELSICERCVLHCTHPEKEISFDIDLSKV